MIENLKDQHIIKVKPVTPLQADNTSCQISYFDRLNKNLQAVFHNFPIKITFEMSF